MLSHANIRLYTRDIIRHKTNLCLESKRYTKVCLHQVFAPKRYNIIPRVNPEHVQLIETVRIIGEGVIYFTIFYCGLNWLHYRRIRHHNEKNDDI